MQDDVPEKQKNTNKLIYANLCDWCVIVSFFKKKEHKYAIIIILHLTFTDY